MGNCCPKEGDSQIQQQPQQQTTTGYRDNANNNNNKSNNYQAFQGQGHKLGTTAQQQNGTATTTTTTATATNNNNNDIIPEPTYDPKITDEEREKIRLERVAAAEARIKKMGSTTNNKPKPKTTTNEPLRGPNSKPLMTWTTG